MTSNRITIILKYYVLTYFRSLNFTIRIVFLKYYNFYVSIIISQYPLHHHIKILFHHPAHFSLYFFEGREREREMREYWMVIGRRITEFGDDWRGPHYVWDPPLVISAIYTKLRLNHHITKIYFSETDKNALTSINNMSCACLRFLWISFP